jgi:hypothetical protein
VVEARPIQFRAEVEFAALGGVGHCRPKVQLSAMP